MDGVFFPQSDLQMPEEKVSQHTGQNMMMPSWIFPDLIVVHPQLRFGFFKTLLNGPSNTAEPNKSRQMGAPGGIADIVGINRVRAKGSLMISHTVLQGRPSLCRVTFLLANSQVIGPLAPSETNLLYQK